MKKFKFFHFPGCSGMFRDVPGCSGMFHVPGFIDALHIVLLPLLISYTLRYRKKEARLISNCNVSV